MGLDSWRTAQAAPRNEIIVLRCKPRVGAPRDGTHPAREQPEAPEWTRLTGHGKVMSPLPSPCPKEGLP